MYHIQNFGKFVSELASSLNRGPPVNELKGHEKSYKRSLDLENDDLYNYLDDMEDYQNLIKKARGPIISLSTVYAS